MNKDNNINIKPYNISKNKIDKSSNFNIITNNTKNKYKSKDSLFNIYIFLFNLLFSNNI